MAVITDDNADNFEKNMKSVLGRLPDNWELKLLKPDKVGAVVEII